MLRVLPLGDFHPSPLKKQHFVFTSSCFFGSLPVCLFCNCLDWQTDNRFQGWFHFSCVHLCFIFILLLRLAIIIWWVKEAEVQKRGARETEAS